VDVTTAADAEMLGRSDAIAFLKNDDSAEGFDNPQFCLSIYLV